MIKGGVVADVMKPNIVAYKCTITCGVLYVLDWCVVCTGLVCCMYWTGVFHVLDTCVSCTGLVCFMYWAGVFHVLD